MMQESTTTRNVKGYSDEDLKAGAEGLKAGAHAKFHVFLSHAGEQKNGFVSVLEADLKREYLHVRYFLDEHSLNPGERAHAKILEAMRNSAVVVIVLSREFVRKLWPMEELRYFLREAKEGRVVCIPVLYKGFTYLDAGRLRQAYDEEDWGVAGSTKPGAAVLDTWAVQVEELLSTTAVRANQVVAEAEADLSQLVVDKVVQQLREHKCMPPNLNAPDVPLPGILVCMEERRDNVIKLLEQHGMVLLHGQGGIGKTTVSHCVYDDLKKTRFAGLACHVVRFGPDKGLKDIPGLQQQMLKVLVSKTVDITEHLDGQMKLKVHLEGKELLLLVDNVWTMDEKGSKINQLEYLLPKDLQLGQGSMVLVTSREKDVTEFMRKNNIKVQGHTAGCHASEVELLSQEASMSLFCQYAFGRGVTAPPADKAEVAREVVAKCDRLPLALEVAGRSLGQLLDVKDWKYWRDDWKELLRTEKCGRNEVHDTLYAVYKVTYDWLSEEERGLLLDVAFWFMEGDWKDLEEYAGRRELQKLVSCCLVKSREDQRGPQVVVHDTLKEFCEIQDPAGSTFHSGDTFELAPSAKRVRAAYKGYKEDPYITLPPGELQCQLLQVDHMDIVLSPDTAMPHLRWLELEYDRGFADISGILKVHTRVVLSPDTFIPHLRWLELDSRCADISGVLKGANNLRVVKLRGKGLNGCRDRLESQEQLQVMRLDSCTGINNAFVSVSKWKHLHTLQILHCDDLTHLPDLSPLCRTLSHLELRGSHVPGLPGLACLHRLQYLILGDDENLAQLPDLSKLVSLRHLELSRLSRISTPRGLAHLTILTMLEVEYMPVESLPGLEHLINLLHVDLCGLNITSLATLDHLPSLEKLGLQNLSSLVELRLQHLPSLKKLEMQDLYSVKQIRLQDLPSLQELGLQDLSSLVELGLQDLPSLEKLGLQDLSSLVVIGLQDLPSLVYLLLTNLPSLVKIKLPDLPILVGFGLQDLSSLMELELKGLPSLVSLKLQDLPNLRHALDVASLVKLTLLDLNGLPYEQLQGLGQLTNLEVLQLVKLSNLNHALDVASLVKLQWLTLRGLPCEQLLGLGQLTKLNYLELRDLPSLTHALDFTPLTQLTEVTLVNLPCELRGLKHVNGWGRDIRNCSGYCSGS